MAIEMNESFLQTKRPAMKIFERYLEEWDISLNERQLCQFQNYYRLLIEWNRVMNLTTITDWEEVVTKHFMDSLSICRCSCGAAANQKPPRLIDVGTGAGFPGIPLKIVYPEIQITLLDSLNKRVRFLNEVITQLDLNGIDAVHSRAEDFARKKEAREQYDLCVSRAVANLASLAEYCLPFVKTGGYFIPYKSGNSDEEIRSANKAVELLGGGISKRTDFMLPATDITRTLLLIRKVKSTPARYPRKAGLPSKEPIVC